MKQQFWKDRRMSSKDCSGWTKQSTTATVRKIDTWMSIWTKKDTHKRRNPRVLSDVQLPRKSKLRDGYLCKRESTSKIQIHFPGSVFNGTIKINCSNRRKSMQPIVVNGKKGKTGVAAIVQAKVTNTTVNTLVQRMIQLFQLLGSSAWTNTKMGGITKTLGMSFKHHVARATKDLVQLLARKQRQVLRKLRRFTWAINSLCMHNIALHPSAKAANLLTTNQSKAANPIKSSRTL